jgi:hypothetical protein
LVSAILSIKYVVYCISPVDTWTSDFRPWSWWFALPRVCHLWHPSSITVLHHSVQS